MATISNTPRPGYVYDSTDGVWYPIGTGAHTHADYITSSSAINPTIVDVKGDIIAATAADTVSRLAVGANDTVLTADSSTATGLKWATPAAGGMTLLSTTTLSGASTLISGINQTYTNLYILITGVTNATSSGRFWCKLNDTNNNAWTAVESGSIVSGTNDLRLSGGNTVTRTDANNAWALNVFNYASTDTYKPFQWSGYWQLTGGSQYIIGGGGYYSNSAISSILFASEGGNLSTGTVRIYGVK